MGLQHQPRIDRRGEPQDTSVWWTRLSVAQKSSADSLGQFGYELAFVRNHNTNNIAILTCSLEVAMINYVGDVDTSPKLHLR